MIKLKKNYIVQKRNILNEIRANSFSLPELRFFSIYLSKINAKDVNTRVVRFPLDDFKAIMELHNIKPNYIQNVTDSLLCKIVRVPDERGGYEAFQLFKECRISKDENEEWYVEIDAHDKALPLMFEFKDKYFSYQLWNALRLKSSNQLRMYEILKQYQNIGYRILAIKDLKELLGIDSEYSKFDNFKIRVLNACQQALAEHTDITFTYEPHGKKGRGGKIIELKFIIKKNENHKDQMTLDAFIKNRKELEKPIPINLNEIDSNTAFNFFDDGRIGEKESRLVFLREALKNEFTVEQVNVLYDILIDEAPSLIHGDDTKLYNHFMAKYNYMHEKRSRGEIKHPFGYLKSIISLTE